MTSFEIFVSAYNTIRAITGTRVIQARDFECIWYNGTGYFDGLAEASPIAPDGTPAVFTDRHGRRGVVFPLSMGNLVIFERYTAGHGAEVVVYNAPPRRDRANGELPEDVDTSGRFSETEADFPSLLKTIKPLLDRAKA